MLCYVTLRYGNNFRGSGPIFSVEFQKWTPIEFCFHARNGHATRTGGMLAEWRTGGGSRCRKCGDGDGCRSVGRRGAVTALRRNPVLARRRRNTASLPINDDLRRRRRHYTGRHFFSDDDDGRRAMARSGRSAAQRDGARRHNNCSNTSCTGSHRGGLPGSLCVTGHSPPPPTSRHLHPLEKKLLRTSIH